MRNVRGISSCSLLVIAEIACSSQDVTCADADGASGVCKGEDVENGDWSPRLPDSPPLSERLEALDRDLDLGSTGSEVRAVHEYLTHFGYFPNDVLREEYPMWRPIVADAPDDPEVFDQRTLEAVSALQRFAGLAVTGSVDEPTRGSLRMQRCGMPEGIIVPDPSEKFALYSELLTDSDLTWKVTSMVGLNESLWNAPPAPAGSTEQQKAALRRQQLAAAVDAAFATWSAAISNRVTFTHTPNAPTVDIEISVEDIGDPDDPRLAQAPFPGGSSPKRFKFDNEPYWWVHPTGSPVEVAETNLPFRYDLETIALHEIGHLIGLQHSSVSGPSTPTLSGSAPPAADVSRATMYYAAARGKKDRALHVDDTIAASLGYEGWYQVFEGAVADIGVGGDGNGDGAPDVWVVGSTGNIHKWTGPPFVSGHAVGGQTAQRIAVGPTGRPWIINSTGQIYERTNTTPTTGSWTRRGTASNCAKDIGVGGTGNGVAYILGCSPNSGGDYKVFKWNGSAWAQVSPIGRGYRISVDGAGVPWIVSWADSNIYRLSAGASAWESVGTGGMDIGAGPAATALSNGVSTPISYVYTVLGNGSIWAWNQQPENLDDGAPTGTAYREGFIPGREGFAHNIAVGPDGVPWVIVNDNGVWSQH